MPGTITQVNLLNGNTNEGSEIEILGSNFGPGPDFGTDQMIYDQFDLGPGKSNGDDINGTHQAQQGAWQNPTTNRPLKYETTHKRVGSASAHAWGGNYNQNQLELGFNSEEFYASYWIYMPPNSGGVPGQATEDVCCYPASCLKMLWTGAKLASGGLNTAINDICTPSQAEQGGDTVAGGAFYKATMTGNGLKPTNPTLVPAANQFWRWKTWSRWDFFVEPGNRIGWRVITPTPDTYSNPAQNFLRYNRGDCPNFNDGAKGFQAASFFGWSGNSGQGAGKCAGNAPVDFSKTQIYIDQFHFQAARQGGGFNAAASILLCNNATFGSAVHVEDLIPVSWTTTRIVARIPKTVQVVGTSNIIIRDDWESFSNGVVVGGASDTPPSVVITVPATAVVNTPVAISAAVTPGTNPVDTTVWSQVSGPGTIVFDNAGATSTNMTCPVQGSYVVKMTVTDDQGLTGVDSANHQATAAPAGNEGGLAAIL